MSMQLLVEAYDIENFEILNESEGENKGLYIQGPFIQMDIVNGNKRFYDNRITVPEVERYIVEKIQKNRAVGELNHPGHPWVNFKEAAIKIVSLIREGSNYIGKAKVIESVPNGAIVAGLIREGVQMAVSSRAVGKTIVNSKGIAVVQEGWRLMTAADVVSEPSAPDAFTTALMENKGWVFENGMFIEEDKQIVENTFATHKNLSYSEKCLIAFNRLMEMRNS